MGNTEPERKVILFTDGGCSGNPGPGGWAFVLRDVETGTTKEKSGGDPETTNNRMEMQAVIEGLKSLKRPVSVKIVSDSQYVIKGITEWMANWKRRGWQRKVGKTMKPVLNVELWKELDGLVQKHRCEFEYVRGHTGHPENERCDELAVAAYQKYL